MAQCVYDIEELKPKTHLKVSLDRKLSEVAHTCASFYFWKSTFKNRRVIFLGQSETHDVID